MKRLKIHSVMRRFLLLSALGAVAVPSLASTVVPSPIPGYVHEIFTAEDGLPRAGISHAVETRDGFLWLATFDGLVRFDGLRFEIFDGERIPALPSNRIAELLETRDGALWVRSDRGHLTRYGEGVFTSCGKPVAGVADCRLEEGSDGYGRWLEDASGTLWVRSDIGLFWYRDGALIEEESLAGQSVKKLFESRAGEFWITTEDGELWRQSSTGFERIATLPWRGPHVNSLAEDENGELWIGSSREVVRFKEGRFETMWHGRGWVQNDSMGTLWLTSGRRLMQFAQGQFETVITSPPRPDPFESQKYDLRSKTIYVGPDGTIWKVWASMLLRDGEPLPAIVNEFWNLSSVIVDRQGIVWAMGEHGELHALRPARVQSLLRDPVYPVIVSVYEDVEGTLWTGGGRHQLEPGGESRSQWGEPKPRNEAQAMLRDREGTLWIGSRRSLFTLHEQGYEGPHGPVELQRTSIRALLESRDGSLWVGTVDGLFHRQRVGHEVRWAHFSEEDGVHPVVRVIRELPDGSLWLGTNGGGVVRFRDGRFTTIDRARGLSSDLVRAIWPAPDGRLWIATENHGLNRLDPTTVDDSEGPEIVAFGKSQGLYSNGIHQIVDDDHGNLWMSSNQGIFRVQLADLNAVADGLKPRLQSIAYTHRDGMLDPEANGGRQNSGLRDREGRIWFPTQKGLVSIDPRVVLAEKSLPRVHLERLHLPLGESDLVSSEVRLSPAERSFRITFTAPDLSRPQDLRFRYRLSPHESDWNDAGSRREAVYSKVPPGDYIFEVAVGSEGRWSEQPTQLAVHAVPRFDETSWFHGLLALMALVGVAAAFQWRERQARYRESKLEELVYERTATIAEQAEELRELDRLKSQFVAKVSHELRTPLTLTLGPLRDLLDGAFGPLGDGVESQLQLVRRNSERLLGLVEQLLDVARLDAGRLELQLAQGNLCALVRGRVEAFLLLAERNRVNLTFEASDGPVRMVLDRRELEKVVDNLLSNAIKFTEAGGSVWVTLEVPQETEEVVLRVRDTGAGISTKQLHRIFERFYRGAPDGKIPGTGLGLALSRQLVELHGGTLSVESREGAGTCFSVTLPRGLQATVEEEVPADGDPAPTEAIGVSTPELSVSTPLDEAASEGRAVVLVADDNAEVRAYIRRHLEGCYTVREAADGLEALALARESTPDLVVSDVMMPGLDGIDLVRSLRRDADLMLVPVVMVTARASSESRLESLREGVDDYLVKPFDAQELLVRVENLLGRRRQLLEHAQESPRGLEISEIEATPADRLFLERVRSVIEERLGDSEMTVATLAELMGCDRSYLLRKLRALVGETPSRLLRSFRLQRAAQLLQANAASVSEIAYAVGFKNVPHFSRAFLEEFGERPSAFATRHRLPSKVSSSGS